MSKHVPTNWLPPIGTRKDRTRTRIRLDLVCQEDNDIVLARDVVQARQVLAKLLLAFRQLATTDIICAEAGDDAVDDEQTELAVDELLRETLKELELVFAVGAAGVCDILLGGFWVKAEAFGDLSDAFRSERAFGVDVHGFASCAAHFLDALVLGEHERDGSGHALGNWAMTHMVWQSWVFPDPVVVVSD
jgi:hypothetical protein